MPNIQFEIDPKVAGLSFATMVFVPKSTASYKWTTIDATDAADGLLVRDAGRPVRRKARNCTLAEIKSRVSQRRVR